MGMKTIVALKSVGRACRAKVTVRNFLIAVAVDVAMIIFIVICWIASWTFSGGLNTAIIRLKYFDMYDWGKRPLRESSRRINRDQKGFCDICRPNTFLQELFIV